MSDDAAWMRRAITLAHERLGRTWPNPSVGCVIVKDGRAVAQAATGEGGRPHAEEQAVAAAGAQAQGAAAYVTLEPCAARSGGGTSCTDVLIAAGVAKVFIACADASPFASGAGTSRLAAAGVAVETGLLADEAAVLNAGFDHRLRTGRPMVQAARTGQGFDALFEPRAEETLEAALRRYGQAGLTRLWTPVGGDMAHDLARVGLLSPPRLEIKP